MGDHGESWEVMGDGRELTCRCGGKALSKSMHALPDA